MYVYQSVVIGLVHNQFRYHDRYLVGKGHNISYSDLPRCPEISLAPPPASLLPLLSVSFPANRLNGSLTPFHVEHDRS